MASEKNPQAEVGEYQRKDRFQQKVGDAVDRLQNELPHRTNQLIAAVAVVVLVALGIFWQVNNVRERDKAEAGRLGAALAAHESGDFLSEKAELEKFLASNPSSALVRAKAALLLGNLNYLERDFDAAEKNFRASAADAGSVALIASAARHGHASALMQKGDYAAAASEWEAFVSSYGKRRGTAREQAAGRDSFDEVALVADALYKLAICRVELGQNDKAREACERILASYGDSRVANQARLVLAAL